MMFKLLIAEPGREQREVFVDVKNIKKLKEVCNLLLPDKSEVEYHPQRDMKQKKAVKK